MELDYIYLDTNAIRNVGLNHFFGKTKDLRRIHDLAEIIVPQMVCDEIRKQKRKTWEKELAGVKKGMFYRFMNGSDEVFNQFSEYLIDTEERLYQNSQEDFHHKKIDLDISNPEHLPNIIEMSMQNKPPFNKDSDKGIKDTIIYLTIIEHMRNLSPEDDVFVWTSDGRLKEAFEEHENVEIIDSVDSYLSLREGYFRESYFIGRLREELEDDGIQSNAVKATLNEKEGIWTIEISSSNEVRKVEVDFVSKEFM